MNIAVIDIGSNTVKITAYDPFGNRLFSSSKTLGIIGYINKGVMSDKGLCLLCDLLCEYVKKSKDAECAEIYAFATASLRALRDPSYVIDKVRERTSLCIELLSGDEEAKITFLDAVCEGSIGKDGVFIDMGGASTEISEYCSGNITRCVSLDFGALLLFKKFVKNILLTYHEAKLIKAHVDSVIENSIGKTENIGKYDRIAVVGGTVRAFASVYANEYSQPFAQDKAYIMSIEKARRLYKRLIKHTTADRLMLISTVPLRIHTLLPGMCAFFRIAKVFGAKEIIVSPSGARYGYYVKVTSNKQ